MRPAIFAIVISIYLTGAIADAQTTRAVNRWEQMGRMPDPANGDRWQDVATAAKWSKADIDAIDRDKILFGQKEFRQIFEPYVASGYPVFITSDSVLNAYHVLFEESIRRMESANAGKLAKLLHELWEPLATTDSGVTGDAGMIATAKLRAQVTLATAMVLLGDNTLKMTPDVAALVQAEVKKIVDAKAMEKPAWLGPPDADLLALDYSRFMPRGFYAESDYLKRYFRATAWLQAIPFRVDNDQELLAAAMIGRAADNSQQALDALFDVLDRLLGPADQPDLANLYWASMGEWPLDLKNPKCLAKIRTEVIDRFKSELPTTQPINDQIRLKPGTKLSLTIRVLSARSTPDAALFEQIQSPDRGLPSGLDVAGALGSSYARQHLLSHGPWDGSMFAPEAHRQSSVYGEYLHCLEALLTEPEKDAPTLFRSAAWQAKSCQTALAGWAQLRHTWQLQAKENAMILGATNRPAGFVEPVPEFYSRMASLCRSVRWTLCSAELGNVDFGQLTADTHTLIALAKKTVPGPDGKPVPYQLAGVEQMHFWPLMLLVNQLQDQLPTNSLPDKLPVLEKLAADLDAGEMPDDTRVKEYAKKNSGPDLDDLWNRLEIICHRLDALANKQLRGVDFNDDENWFLKDYGDELGGVMLYSGNSYEAPRDDAPRIADVCQNPVKSEFLEVGIGRPRALYVLYPWHNGEVLCEGAAMPYYEFANRQRLTDADWKSMLDSKNPPSPFIKLTPEASK
jgi:hypothetical protein